MPAVILDACGAVNLYASGNFIAILEVLEHEWYLPAAVESESQSYRQPDPSDPEKLIVMLIDFSAAFAKGVLQRCDCQSEQEQELYVELASRIGDDGESMGLALAKCRGWSVLTDDKKARKLASELGVAVFTTTEIVKQWSDLAKPSASELATILKAIERYANYLPGRNAAHFEWWTKSIIAGIA